jgi:rod shape determining protein RodA
MWIGISFAVFFVFALVDWRFLRRTWIVVTLYLISLASLILVLLIGDVTLGAQSRFNLGPIAVQPADPAKLVTIILLAKYFTRRHIEIANIKHILVSGFYAFTLFALVFLQPDFGSAIIIAAIWFGMVLVSGISKKHLAGVLLIGIISAIGLWFFGLEDYQKERIMTFLHPYTDVQGTGYNAYQSTIAVGSGQVLGKGLGYGTQSRLEFLPEYETDFIFAAFAEEWGFVGVLILFSLFGIVIWRILDTALYGATNFEVLFGVGVATLFMSHFVIHVGMNVGLLPVTGTTIPLLSYGGSHLVTEFAALGMLMGMRAYRRTLHRDHLPQELVGV